MQAGMTKCTVDVLLFLKFHFKTRHTRQEGDVQSLQNLALTERCWEPLIFSPNLTLQLEKLRPPWSSESPALAPVYLAGSMPVGWDLLTSMAN